MYISCLFVKKVYGYLKFGWLDNRQYNLCYTSKGNIIHIYLKESFLDMCAVLYFFF